MENGNVAMISIGLAGFAVFGLFVAFMCVMIEGSWSEIRRKLQPVGERICAVAAAISAGVKSLLLEFDDDAVDAMNRKH